MMLLIGAVGWGLLAIGSITHVWHHRRLRELLAMHFDHEAIPALSLTAAELSLAIGLPTAVLVDAVPVLPFVVAACALALVFCAWITRLLVSNSTLPCACSFSAGPTTVWALGRAAAAVSVLALLEASASDLALTITTFVVGLAFACGIFVLPESTSWPAASRALLARADAHEPAMRSARQ